MNSERSIPVQIKEIVQEALAEVTPYRAIVTGGSSGMVQFRPIEAATGSTQLYARIAGFALAVSDEIMVVGRKNPIIYGKIQRATATSFALTAPLTSQTSQVVTFGPLVRNDLAANATATLQAGFFNDATALSQSTGAIYIPRNGEIVGIYATTDANRTSGTATIQAVVDGTPVTLDGGATCVIDGTNTRRHSVHVANGDGEDVTAGQRVELQVVTSSWGPTTANLVGWVAVRLDF